MAILKSPRGDSLGRTSTPKILVQESKIQTADGNATITSMLGIYKGKVEFGSETKEADVECKDYKDNDCFNDNRHSNCGFLQFSGSVKSLNSLTCVARPRLPLPRVNKESRGHGTIGPVFQMLF